MSEDTARSTTFEREIEQEIDQEQLALSARRWWKGVFLSAPDKRSQLKTRARRARTREKFIRREMRSMLAAADGLDIPQGRAEYLFGVCYDLLTEVSN